MVVSELRGEKIDIIPYNDEPARFVAKALSPARVREVLVDDEPRQATVIVPDDQLSLAIGREGQNARLAARLTGWRIDIRSETEFATEAQDDGGYDEAGDRRPLRGDPGAPAAAARTRRSPGSRVLRPAAAPGALALRHALRARRPRPLSDEEIADLADPDASRGRTSPTSWPGAGRGRGDHGRRPRPSEAAAAEAARPPRRGGADGEDAPDGARARRGGRSGRGRSSTEAEEPTRASAEAGEPAREDQPRAAAPRAALHRLRARAAQGRAAPPRARRRRASSPTRRPRCPGRGAYVCDARVRARGAGTAERCTRPSGARSRPDPTS